MKNKYTKLASDTLIFGIGNFTTKLIYFFLMPIYTLTLTESEFGLSDLLNNSLQLILPILTICISDAVFRFALDEDVNLKILLNESLRIINIGILIVVIATLIIYYITRQSYWILFGLLYITESYKLLLAQFTRGLGKVKSFALNGIIAAIVLFCTTYLFLKICRFGINGYILSFICANTCACLYLLFVVDIQKYVGIKEHDKQMIRAMVIYSVPLVPNMLSWWFTNISSRYIIAGYCGLSVAGLFAAASKLPALINIISSIFQQSWQYASVKEYQETDKTVFYETVFRFYSAIVMIGSSIIILIIPYISKIILLNEFYNGWIYTPLLLYSATLGCFSIYFGTFYSVVKNNKKVMQTTVIGGILTISISLISIPIIGVYGALVANVCSFMAIVFLRIRDVQKFMNIKIGYIKFIAANILLLFQAIIMTINMSYLLYCAIVIILSITALYFKDISALFKRLFKLI